MRRLSKQRRRVVVLAAGVSVLASADALILPRRLPERWEWVRWAWLGVGMVLLVCVMVLMAKLKRDEG